MSTVRNNMISQNKKHNYPSTIKTSIIKNINSVIYDHLALVSLYTCSSVPGHFAMVVFMEVCYN